MQRTNRVARLLAALTLAILTLVIARPVAADSPPATATPTSGATVAGPLTPPAAALHANGMPGSGLHALGYVPDRPPSSAQAVPAVASAASLPASVDLSQYNPPVGDQ